MKIVADENIPLSEDFFAGHGEVVRVPGRTLTARQLEGAEVLLVRSVTRVNELLLADSQVGFVGTCTIGMDHLDQDWLDQRGITYTNAPGCNANSVVEYVYAALATLNIDWRQKTVGIVGGGNVGGLLHRRLVAQGVTCLCYDPFLTIEQNPDLAELEDVLQCEIVCLHTPLTTTGDYPTRHLLGYGELMQLPPGAVLISAGRGEVVDNQALLKVLHTRDDLQVVLDVWEAEPAISLDLLDKVALGTPHIAGYSYDGKLKGTAMIYAAFCRYRGEAEQTTLEQVTPGVADDCLHLPAADDWSVVQGLIKQVYDISADDQRLRALATAVRAGEQSLAEGFDALRKHYPVRREFRNYRVAVDQTEKKPLAETLAAIGFSTDNND